MPRLRALKKPEDIAAVPPDEEVLIDLTPDDPEPEIDDKEPKPAPKVREPEPEPEPQGDDATAVLRQQLEAAQSAEKAARELAASEARRREDAERRAAEREEEATRERDNAEQAQYDTQVNGIAAMQAEIEAAQQAAEAADAAGDRRAQFDAIRRVARAEVALSRYEENKAALDARREDVKRNPPRPAAAPSTFEASVDANPNLISEEKAWIKAHPEALTDPRRNAKLQAAYWDATDKGLTRGSADYFKFIEEQLGYRKAEAPPPATEDDDEPQPQAQPQTRRATPVSAPVSREVPSASTGRPSSQRITLTPEQREAARVSGIDEKTYARNVQKLQELKRQGHYQER